MACFLCVSLELLKYKCKPLLFGLFVGYRQGYFPTGKYPRAADVPMHKPKRIYLQFKVSLKVDQLLKYDVFQAANTNGGTYLKWSNPLQKYFEFLTLLCIEDNMFDS